MLYLDECSFIASRFGQRWKNYSNIQNKLPVSKTLYQGKMKEDELEGRPRNLLGCDVGLEPTTTRTTIWCSTN